jgi:hypothetical protein
MTTDIISVIKCEKNDISTQNIYDDCIKNKDVIYYINNNIDYHNQFKHTLFGLNNNSFGISDDECKIIRLYSLVNAPLNLYLLNNYVIKTNIGDMHILLSDVKIAEYIKLLDMRYPTSRIQYYGRNEMYDILDDSQQDDSKIYKRMFCERILANMYNILLNSTRHILSCPITLFRGTTYEFIKPSFKEHKCDKKCINNLHHKGIHISKIFLSCSYDDKIAYNPIFLNDCIMHIHVASNGKLITTSSCSNSTEYEIILPPETIYFIMSNEIEYVIYDGTIQNSFITNLMTGTEIFKLCDAIAPTDYISKYKQEYKKYAKYIIDYDTVSLFTKRHPSKIYSEIKHNNNYVIKKINKVTMIYSS